MNEHMSTAPPSSDKTTFIPAEIPAIPDPLEAKDMNLERVDRDAQDQTHIDAAVAKAVEFERKCALRISLWNADLNAVRRALAQRASVKEDVVSAVKPKKPADE